LHLEPKFGALIIFLGVVKGGFSQNFSNNEAQSHVQIIATFLQLAI